MRIHGIGSYYVFDSDQETSNIQHSTFEYEDGTILQFEVRGLYSNDELGVRIGNLFFGSAGWMSIKCREVKTFFGRKNEPEPTFSDNVATNNMDLNRRHKRKPMAKLHQLYENKKMAGP